MMFPFTLPTATAFYLVLYLGTLVLHAIFMSYVLAGSAYVAAMRLLGREQADDPVMELLHSWLPFMLGMAITAGVAPLLFVQILYRTPFYTANLLLFHRWMAVLPALVCGFYLLYLLKNRWDARRSRALSVGVAFAAAVCFGFVAWSWTENHLLSLQGQAVWTEQYVGGSLVFRSAQVLPRLAMWCCGAFQVLSIWVSWQLWWPHRKGAAHDVPAARRMAITGLAGLSGAVLCGGVYVLVMPDEQRRALLDASFLPYGAIVVATLAGQGFLQWRQFQSHELCPKRLTLLSGLAVIMLLGAAVVRESLRIASLDMAALAEPHQQSAEVGGFSAFVGFLAINSLAIVWCLRTVLKAVGSNDQTGSFNGKQESNRPMC